MSDEDVMPSIDEAVALPAQLSPGQQLAERRQAAGWTIEQVAAQLKLAPRQIEALENDRLDALPGAMVARGFIRSYARLLKMDPAPLLATVSTDIRSPIESIRQQRPLSAPFSETRLPSMHAPKASWTWLPVLLLLGAVAVGISGAQRADWQAILPESVAAWLGESSSASVPEAQAVGGETAPPVAAVEPAPAVEVVPLAAESPQLAPAEATVPAKTESPVATVSQQAIAPAAAAGNQLNLTLHQDSWIEIKRQDSSVMVSRLAKAGTTETFEIAEPVLLVVGNVAGVEASLRNAPLNLKATTSTNVARINLK
ncbi:MAG: RodZ domain-containing protein [Burkholderiaceae bacterium]